MVRRHAELLAGLQGRGCTAGKELRKHMAWYFKGFPVGGDLRRCSAWSPASPSSTISLGQLARTRRSRSASWDAARSPGLAARPGGSARGLAGRHQRRSTSTWPTPSSGSRVADAGDDRIDGRRRTSLLARSSGPRPCTVTPTAGLVRAHATSHALTGPGPVVARELREEREARSLRPGATRARGAGNRARDEEPDTERTCFERDRDRIVHSTAFRRLAGKTQVVVYPSDHQRTRLDPRPRGRPGRHLDRSRDRRQRRPRRGDRARSRLRPRTRRPRQRGRVRRLPRRRLRPRAVGSRRRPRPAQPLRRDPRRHPQPLLVAARAGDHRGRDRQLGRPDRLLRARPRGRRPCRHRGRGRHPGRGRRGLRPDVGASSCGPSSAPCCGPSTATARSGMEPDAAAALSALRAFNYERIYVRPASLAQSRAVVAVLRALVEFYAERPAACPRRRRSTRPRRRRRRSAPPSRMWPG